MGMSTSRGKGPMAEINVTPMVDVMLVLLIIFMVAAPMLSQGLDVNLPETKVVKNLPTEKDYIVLTIDAQETIHIDKTVVGMDEVQDWVERLVAKENKQLFIKADRGVNYGVVVQVMGEVSAAGVEHVNVFAEQATAKSGKR